LIAAGTRYSSLAALVAAIWAVLIVALETDGHLFVLTFILAVLIYARHHTNIKRLRAGEEPKIQRN
ncbi:MAG: glycerol-3-phosphate acyltransferase, partial [Planktomarina sp.]|nr:glycerol-3-phosphate acyltransferase [Planktomarina sp.]